MSHKLTVALTQYTPLLHFQGDVPGACLRASEVKPALDLFLLACLPKEITLPRSWCCEGSHALRYRMTFRGDKRTVDRNIHALYFAKAPATRAVWYPDMMTMDIVALSPERIVLEGETMTLAEVIARYLPAFFALHCFGARSNKGFGSFGVKAINGTAVPTLRPDALTGCAPSGVLYSLDHGSVPESSAVLDEVALLSDIMKRGINDTHGDPESDQYLKGLIFQYIMETAGGGVHSEKAVIKKKLLNDRAAQEEDAYVQKAFGKQPLEEDAKCRYIRSLLGLAGTYQYKIDRDNPHSRRAGRVFVRSLDKRVERFENPVHFKPYGQYLLLIPQPMPDAVLGAEFSFEIKDAATRRTQKEEAIRTPDQFSLDGFLQYFCRRVKEDADVYRFLGGPRDIQRFSGRPE